MGSWDGLGWYGIEARLDFSLELRVYSTWLHRGETNEAILART